MAGKFYGVGVGPGDPELLTFKAYRTLLECEIVCVPKSADDRDSLALNPVRNKLPGGFKLLELSFPMSRDVKALEESWSKAGEEIAALVQKGWKVAFLTIGDPLFYSTYGYVLRYLKKNYPEIETETIPGVTSLSACSACLRIPLAEGKETLAVLPAAYGTDDLKRVLQSFDNVVLMKVNRRLPEVVAILEELGLKEKAVFASRCGYTDQFFTRNLESLLEQPLDYMSMLIVKKRGSY